MTRFTLCRRFVPLVFGILLALGLLAPQIASASNPPPNPALNPAVIPDLPIKLACTPSGGAITGLWVEWEESLAGNPVLRFEFNTQKNTTATVKYRLHGSNGPWTSAYKHFTPDFTTDHIFFTYDLADNAHYDVVIKTYQCNQVVDTENEEYWT